MVKLIKGDIIPLTDDDMFTEVFNNKENMCFIEEFIATYFNYPLEEIKGNIKIQPRKLSRNLATEKSKEVDLFLKYGNKNINIEMTTGWNQPVIDRNVVFLANIHGRQLEKGNNYNIIDESIQLNFCSFSNRGKTRDIYFLKNQYDEILTHKLKIEIVYMEELKKMCYTDDEETNMLINWSKVFESTTRKELEKVLHKLVSRSSKKQLLHDVTRLSGDEKMVNKYNDKSKWEATRDMIMADFEEQRKQLNAQKNEIAEQKNEIAEQKNEIAEQKNEIAEREKKLKEQKLSIINGLLNNNFSSEEISNLSGMSLDEVNKLLKER